MTPGRATLDDSGGASDNSAMALHAPRLPFSVDLLDGGGEAPHAQKALADPGLGRANRRSGREGSRGSESVEWLSGRGRLPGSERVCLCGSELSGTTGPCPSLAAGTGRQLLGMDAPPAPSQGSRLGTRRHRKRLEGDRDRSPGGRLHVHALRVLTPEANRSVRNAQPKPRMNFASSDIRDDSRHGVNDSNKPRTPMTRRFRLYI